MNKRLFQSPYDCCQKAKINTMELLGFYYTNLNAIEIVCMNRHYCSFKRKTFSTVDDSDCEEDLIVVFLQCFINSLDKTSYCYGKY